MFHFEAKFYLLFLMQEDETVGTSDASVDDPVATWQSDSSSRYIY